MSQTINLWILLGHHDQTVSARCYCNRHRKGWRVAYKLINLLFWWQEDHCKASYLADVEFSNEIIRGCSNRPE
jgi:uncharacterized protein YaeQ